MKFKAVHAGNFTSDLLEYINELYSASPGQEYTAVQRTVFDNWYEQNPSLWENAKKSRPDDSIPKRKPKGVRPKVSKTVKKTVKEVNTILNKLKRFSIKSIEIQNFKSIENLTLHVKPVDDKGNRESWLLLLGDNGIGKSSILQAIALALTPKKQLQVLDLDVSDYLKKDTRSGMIVIHSYEHDKPITLQFSKKGFKTKLEVAPTFILGYGSTRLLPKGKIKPDGKREPYWNIKNLFDYSVALHDPNAWLSKVNRTEFDDRVAPAFFDVLALRGNDRLWVKNGKICIQQFGEDHELEENSDGYKTITALVSDIMQTLSIDQANYHNAQGIVLIDEIGNHLHPRWRMKIVSALRKAFPRLQFIVTTHEPLCLRGLSHGEVVVLVRDQHNLVKALESDLLPDHNLMRVEQLLTSDLFGLINILDEDAEKSYEEYYNLLSKKDEEKTTEDKNKINELSKKMAEREMLGSTSSEQALYEMISQAAQKIKTEGFKTRVALKKETIELASTMLKEKNLDW